MSAESGVPTYRGQGGIWKEYDYQRFACQRAFERDPDGVWEFHNYRRGLVAACAPHRGHELITRAEQALDDVVVVTQNIDGMHQRAGTERVLELHGSLWRTRCEACGKEEANAQSPLEETRCSCGAPKRPAIVWFGDALDGDTIREAATAIAHADVLVSIGTSATVYPAAELPLIARERGAHLIEINPDPTPLSDAYDEHLRGPAGEMLGVLAKRWGLD